MPSDNSLKLILGLAFVAVALCVYGVLTANCAALGGVLVRGVFWYECVEAKR